jgi:ATP-binding protein involved in chromosome partitioning
MPPPDATGSSPATGPADAPGLRPGSAPDALASSVLAALASVIDPEIRRPITELDMVESVQAGDDGRVQVGIRLTIV